MTTTDLYEALTWEVERADALAEHLADRLSDLSEGEPRELHALSLVAQRIRERHAQVIGKAGALLASGGVRSADRRRRAWSSVHRRPDRCPLDRVA
jgi:hypothetical protein